MRSLVICKYRDSNTVWEPFPHLKCDDCSECGIDMDCPAIGEVEMYPTLSIAEPLTLTLFLCVYP